jgi:hypothetical protein
MPGFVIAFIAIILVSLVTEKPGEDVLNKFDTVQDLVKLG